VRRPLPRSYAHVPRTILWLVPGGEIDQGGCTVAVEPFYLGKWPITNEQFEAFAPDYRRSPVSPGDRDLATGVNFEQADAYCRWYAEVSRKPMRLPTDVEWRYACRGTERADELPSWCATPESVDRCCWHADNSEGRVQPPEQKAANGFGLHGMLGSVWEWVAPDASAGDSRTLRGGSFRLAAAELDCETARRESADFADDDTGFRVARSFRTRPG
jgi:formylglycine-generating enzyme required for sulfatase activity